MILKLFNFENDIDLSKDNISVLEIENKKLFSKLLIELQKKLAGAIVTEEEFYIFENEKELHFNDISFVVFDPLNIDFNHKKIVSALTKELLEIYNQDEVLKVKFQDDYSALISDLNEVLNLSNVDYIYNIKFDFVKLLKLLSLSINSDACENILDKLLLLIDLVSNLKFCRLLILINIKSYLSSDELQEFYKYACYNNAKLLLLESNISYHLLEKEKKLKIDFEFDEFKY